MLMRTPNLITCSCLIILLSLVTVNQGFANGQSPQTQIIPRDFGDTAVLNAEGINMFAYSVNQSLEQEYPGGWINGNIYECNWTVSLDYVNQDFINGSSYILFYLPTPIDTDPLYMPINTNVTAQGAINQIQLNQTQKTGILSATFKPENTDGYYFGLNLRLAVYINGVNSSADLSKGAGENPGFSTEVYNSTQDLETAYAPEFPSIAIGIFLMVMVSISVLVVRKQKLLDRHQ